MRITAKSVKNTLLGLIISLLVILNVQLVLIYINSDQFLRVKLSSQCTRSSNFGYIKENAYTLVRIENNKCIPMFSYKGEDSSAPTARWKNMLFLGSSTYADNVKVFALDTVSNNIKTLFDSNEISYGPKQSKPYQLLGFNVIGNTLYFAPSGYNNSYYSDFSYVDLPLKFNSKTVKLANLPTNGNVRQINNYPFFISKNYAKCSSEYSFFNTSQKAIGKPIGTFKECPPGEMLITANDGNFNLIVSTTIPSNPNLDTLNINFFPIYTSISLIPFSDPSKRIPLLTNETMPKNISWVTYEQNENKIYLSGKDLYVYDIASKSLNKIIALTNKTDERFQIGYVNGDELCLQSVSPKIEGPIFLNKRTRTIKQRTAYEACYNDKEYIANTDYSENSEMIKNIFLPSNYAIIVTPHN